MARDSQSTLKDQTTFTGKPAAIKTTNTVSEALKTEARAHKWIQRHIYKQIHV